MHLHMTEIADLIEVCFRDKLDVTARRAVREMRALSRTGPLLWMLGLIPHNGLNWNHGYVFLHDGRVIGSVGAQPSDSGPQAYLIANVAVHPNFRRQGVARGLMLAVLSKAARQGAKCIVLQVDEDNEEAITLYQDLGFDTLTTRTLWLRTNSTAPNLIKRGHNIDYRRWITCYVNKTRQACVDWQKDNMARLDKLSQKYSVNVKQYKESVR